MNEFILRVTYIIIYYCGGETTIGAQQSITQCKTHCHSTTSTVVSAMLIKYLRELKPFWYWKKGEQHNRHGKHKTLAGKKRYIPCVATRKSSFNCYMDLYIIINYYFYWNTNAKNHICHWLVLEYIIIN